MDVDPLEETSESIPATSANNIEESESLPPLSKSRYDLRNQSRQEQLRVMNVLKGEIEKNWVISPEIKSYSVPRKSNTYSGMGSSGAGDHIKQLNVNSNHNNNHVNRMVRRFSDSPLSKTNPSMLRRKLRNDPKPAAFNRIQDTIELEDDPLTHEILAERALTSFFKHEQVMNSSATGSNNNLQPNQSVLGDSIGSKNNNTMVNDNAAMQTDSTTQQHSPALSHADDYGALSLETFALPQPSILSSTSQSRSASPTALNYANFDAGSESSTDQLHQLFQHHQHQPQQQRFAVPKLKRKMSDSPETRYDPYKRSLARAGTPSPSTVPASPWKIQHLTPERFKRLKRNRAVSDSSSLEDFPLHSSVGNSAGQVNNNNNNNSKSRNQSISRTPRFSSISSDAGADCGSSTNANDTEDSVDDSVSQASTSREYMEYQERYHWRQNEDEEWEDGHETE